MNVYSLDKDDRIVSVEGSWDEFATENGGVGVFADDVYGRPYWSFVTGDVTRMWVAAVFQAVRVRGEVVTRPYRCDSPNLKRFMQMRVIPEQKHSLRIEHVIMRTEPRIPTVQIQYAGRKVIDKLERCSVCGRVKKDRWEEPLVEHAPTSGIIHVTYSVCDDCNWNVLGK